MPKALSRWRSNVIQPLGPPLRRLARLGHLISGKTSKCTTNVALLRPALLRVPGRVWNLEGSRRRERTAAKTGSGCNSFVELSRSYRVGGSRNSLKSQQFCCRDNLPNGTLHTRVSKSHSTNFSQWNTDDFSWKCIRKDWSEHANHSGNQVTPQGKTLQTRLCHFST